MELALKKSNLFKRTFAAVVLIPIVITLLYLGGDWMKIGLILATAVACFEFYQILEHMGYKPFFYLGTVLTGLIVLESGPSTDGKFTFLYAAVILTFSYALFANRDLKNAILDALLTIAGVLYIGMLGYLILLRELPKGFEWSLLAITLICVADTGAYIFGKLLGRHKLYPRITPGKTWEGVAGGVFLTIIAAAILDIYLLHLTTWWLSIVLGIVVTVFGLFGDLVESLLKRAANVKDSGTLIPGHGGLLDRIDGWFFAIPAVYYFAKLFG